MMHWLEDHALECLVIAYLFSAIISVMPPLSKGAGWGAQWAYGILQVFGANAGNLVKHTPAGAQLESVLESQVHTAADGSQTTTEISSVKRPEKTEIATIAEVKK